MKTHILITAVFLLMSLAVFSQRDTADSNIRTTDPNGFEMILACVVSGQTFKQMHS